jgi:hypothetical protein
MLKGPSLRVAALGSDFWGPLFSCLLVVAKAIFGGMDDGTRAEAEALKRG